MQESCSREDEGKQSRTWMRAEADSVLIKAGLGHIPLCLNISHNRRFTSRLLVTAICFTVLNLWMLMREGYSISWETPTGGPQCCSHNCGLHPGVPTYLTGCCVHPYLRRSADKPVSGYLETPCFPSLLGLRSTLVNSQTAGCVLKSIYISDGQVIVCGELSFLLWRTMGAFLLCSVGSAAECCKHCLTGSSIFCGLRFAVMLRVISHSAEATDTSRQGLGGWATGTVTFCVEWRSRRMLIAFILQSTWKITTWKQIIFVL